MPRSDKRKRNLYVGYTDLQQDFSVATREFLASNRSCFIPCKLFARVSWCELLVRLSVMAGYVDFTEFLKRC